MKEKIEEAIKEVDTHINSTYNPTVGSPNMEAVAKLLQIKQNYIKMLIEHYPS